MKRRTWAITIAGVLTSIAIPLVTTVTPFAIRDAVSASALFTGLVVLFLTLVGAGIVELSDHIKSMVGSFTTVEAIPENEFYDRFIEAVRTAQRRVKLAYMSNKSPLETTDPVMRDYYYKRIPTEIKKRRDLEFRRIVRAIPQLQNWIESMVSDLEGTNFSLACYPGTNPQVDSVDIVSVQCLDADKVFLVAVGEQQETREPRDLFVQSGEFNRVWNSYYDRVWSRSVTVLDRGRINVGNLNKVREMIKATTTADDQPKAA